MSAIYNKNNNNTEILAANEPSICIPRMFANLNSKCVFDVFADLFGAQYIDCVDSVNKTNEKGEEYKRAFVHFKSWPNTYEAQEFRRRLVEGKEVKVIYSDPWFWKCSASRVKRPDAQNIVQPRAPRQPVRPYVDLSDATTTRGAAGAGAVEKTPVRPFVPRSAPNAPRKPILVENTGKVFRPRQIMTRNKPQQQNDVKKKLQFDEEKTQTPAAAAPKEESSSDDE
jgi:hypothetical protein